MCNNLKAILNSYCKASGLIINFSKFEVFFSRGYDDIYATLVREFLGVSVQNKSDKYLELPFCVGISKNAALSFIFDCIRQKLNSWNRPSCPKPGVKYLLN